MTAAEPRRAPRACLTIAVGGLVLRLVLATRSLAILDRLFVPDDTYYTLAVARSIARGLGPSVDGGAHLTSGFQPLLAFLLAPIFWCTTDADVAFRSALVFGAIADAGSAWLLGHLAFHIGSQHGGGTRRGVVAAVVATTLWAFSTSAIATSLNGLETSLAVTCMLGALAAWCAACVTKKRSAWLLTGVLLGLCLLARVDTVFFVATVGVLTLALFGLRVAITSVAGAGVTVGPWWAYAFVRFGTIIPESGAAVREQAMMYKAMGINVRDQVAFAAGAIVGPPMFDSSWLRHALGIGASAIGFAIGMLLVVLALTLARKAWREQSHAVCALAIYASCIFLFYALYLPATWFFRRYLVPVHAVVDIVVALALAHAWERRGDHPWRARAVAVVALGCVVASLVTYTRLATSTPTMSIDQGHDGAKGYREPARHILAIAPRGSVIGSFQSGALAYFADGSSPRPAAAAAAVVNLDGVVDGEAARAVRERRIASFARSRGVTHLADWDVNVKLFLDRSGDARLTRDSLHAVGAAEHQGEEEQFVLYEIEWPAPDDRD